MLTGQEKDLISAYRFLNEAEKAELEEYIYILLKKKGHSI